MSRRWKANIGFYSHWWLKSRRLHKRFSIRPRAAGLWMRMTLTDGDELEGLAANDRSLLEGAGVLLTPPDTRSNTQRIYVPRAAIAELTLLAVITTPSRRPSLAPRPAKENLQDELFHLPLDPDSRPN